LTPKEHGAARERERLAVDKDAERQERQLLAAEQAFELGESSRCEICGGVERRLRYGPRKQLAQDHCHKTGLNRGLLWSAAT
jgi:hypothetical protein